MSHGGEDDAPTKESFLSDRTLTVIQALTGGAYGLFLFPHLLNLSSVIVSVDTANDVMEMLRVLYRDPNFEVVVIGVCPIVHVAAGSVKAYRRSAGAAVKTLPDEHDLAEQGLLKAGASREDVVKQARPSHIVDEKNWMRSAGWSLVVLKSAHFLALRLSRYLPQLYWKSRETDLISYSFVSLAMNRYPIAATLGSLTLALAGVYHGVSGARIAYRELFRGMPSFDASREKAQTTRDVYLAPPSTFSPPLTVTHAIGLLTATTAVAVLSGLLGDVYVSSRKELNALLDWIAGGDWLSVR
ncbi:hypothetical protein M427DRAFT_143172 [Gonapodya prolifera JEL478]|uniref:Mitochondrial adapter protein MCP1 transmembrane domain-containing protein n=1 Tax=Gonapodya prolifera (strain JEL478) TaxID=1344416 RepID=A0A139ATD6_GONPJ|nr:hypothetical protein M427DRAFT_143172 [Gonapodya prolifera JEL478]|eukprot:KXS19954.1 hypothetical protein M427DRAFT_143172 [Gonapodya prolifera JEL478]